MPHDWGPKGRSVHTRPDDGDVTSTASGSKRPLDVAIYDASGSQITTFGGGGLVSTNNSSTATLGISGVFTGTGDEVINYSQIAINVFADVASATDGLQVQFSSDNTNWVTTHRETISAGSTHFVSVQIGARYFRIVYTNGGTGQSAFRLQSVFVNGTSVGTLHALDEDLTGADVAQTTKAILAAETSTGAYDNIVLTAGAELPVLATAQPGTDIGDVTINNASGGSAVNIQDGGNSITVDDGGTTVSVDDGGGSLTVDNAALSVTGGGAEATALRVTIANDSTGVVSVDDNGSTISVDDGGGALTVDGNVSPDTSVVDANNSSSTPLGGGAAFTGTATDVTGYSTVTFLVHADVDSATGGIQAQFSVDSSNWDESLDFTLDASSSTTRRFQFAVNAQYFRVVYTNGASAQAEFRLQTILHRSNTLTSIHRFGDSITADRSCQVIKAGLTGQDAIAGDFKNVKTFDAAGSFTSLLTVPIDTSANPMQILATGADATANTTNQTAVAAFGYGYNGSTWDRLRSDTTNGLDVDVTRVGGTVDVQGDVAHDAADSGDPLKIGGKARTSNPTAVANSDRVDGFFDDVGRQVVRVGQARDLVTDGRITLSSTTETTVIAAGGAGVFHDLTELILSNTSEESVTVTIRDDTAGTARLIIGLPPKVAFKHSWVRPKNATAANDNWTAQLDAAVSDVEVYMQCEVNV